MKNKLKQLLTIILILLLLASCTVNLYRPIDITAVDLRKVERDFLSSTGAFIDTVLTLRKSDCQINSEDYFITLYKTDGLTKSQVFTNYGNYPNEHTIDSFNWSKIIASIDSIKYQTPKPSYYGTIIEGDTTWYQNGVFSSEKVWTFKLYCKTDTVIWETFTTERQTNPSMDKTIVSEYILSETYNKIWGMTQPYGEIKYKKKSIISRR